MMVNVRRMLLTVIIWIICFIAIVAGVVLTYTWMRNLGPEITISFDDASGMVPHQTPISYRGVYMGWVRSIQLDEKTGRALVIARMTRQAEQMLGPDTKFWIVGPEFSLGHSSNLNTLATGDYISMTPSKGKLTTQFRGLDIPPVDPLLAEGLEINLRAVDAGGVSVGSPILYKGLQIGEVGDMGITDDKNRVLVHIYIYKRFADLVRASTFFGNVSGFHASIHIFGASEIGMDSLKTMLSGGIVMVTPNMGAAAAKAGDTYDLIPAEAMQHIMGDD